jgi:hypothetical protein
MCVNGLPVLGESMPSASAASAALLGPTRDGRLFLSARRKQRTRIRALEIIQNLASRWLKLVQLMRGIYVDPVDDIDATVLRHAVRIAKYLYPRAPPQDISHLSVLQVRKS